MYLFGGSVVDDKGEVIRLWGCEDFLPKSIDDNAIIEILNRVIPPVDVTSWTMEEPASMPSAEEQASAGAVDRYGRAVLDIGVMSFDAATAMTLPTGRD